jgi:hypothetical protein
VSFHDQENRICDSAAHCLHGILRGTGDNSFEIDLIEGAVAVDKTVTASALSITAPVKILRNGCNTSLQPLSLDECKPILTQLKLAPPTS